MQPGVEHRWDLTPEEARRLQRDPASQVSQVDDLGDLRTVAGLDLGYPRTETGEEIGRAAVVLRYPSLDPVEERIVHLPVSIPYVPSPLSFHEAPVGLAAMGSYPRCVDSSRSSLFSSLPSRPQTHLRARRAIRPMIPVI